MTAFQKLVNDLVQALNIGHVQEKIIDIANSGIQLPDPLPYTSYVAKLAYSGGGFAVTQFENSIGDGTNNGSSDIAWSNPSNGVIRGTMSSANFSATKTFVNCSNMVANGSVYYAVAPKVTSATQIDFVILDTSAYPPVVPSGTPYFPSIFIDVRLYQ